MENNESSFQIDQVADYLKTELLRRQAEVEKETGYKPALEDLFLEFKQKLIANLIPGQQEPDDDTPSVYELKMPGAIPGIRNSAFHTCFIPDLPVLSHWKRVSTILYNDYEKQDAENLHKLYLDARFQRLSCTLEGRMAIIGYSEGKDYRTFPEEYESYSNYYGSLEHQLNQPPENYGEPAKAFIKQYGEKYHLKWLVHNEPPLPKVFLDPKWLNGTNLIACWWDYIKHPLSEEFHIPEIASLLSQSVNKQLEWIISLPKFQKLSRTLQGRLDMICSIERIPKERMMEHLSISNAHLADFEENEELIREKLTEAYGMSYGNVWVAYGLTGGADFRFVYHALDNKHHFLDRVPALFRTARPRTRMHIADEDDTPENGELNNSQRTCLNCGRTIEGRSDKLFCDGGACQRTYYNKKHRRSQALNGNPQHKQDNTAKSEEKEETGLIGIIGALIKGPGGVFLNKVAEDAAESLSEKIFGKKQGQSSTATSQPEQNNPPPPKTKVVDGEEIQKRQFDPGVQIFTPAFTKFFGKLHIPFKLLIWGLPGQGKSSFCIKLCNALALAGLPGTYVSAEEDPEGDTMQDKIYLNWKGKLTMKFVNTLPDSSEKWHELLLRKDEKGKEKLNSFFIIYDSVTKLEQKPGLADRVQKLFGKDNLNEVVSHIYIAHAEKDGSTYQGEVGWEYEADIVISVDDAGIATMRKNRFKNAAEGQIGGTFNFFTGRIAAAPRMD